MDRNRDRDRENEKIPNHPQIPASRPPYYIRTPAPLDFLPEADNSRHAVTLHSRAQTPKRKHSISFVALVLLNRESDRSHF
jgi:hypothetical protein